ncbi:hypothetical protein SRABI84_04600 [Peribacillus simplex]|nr:hypothetical protein SRABI84_04600 [Peribacillus simplex]
MHQWYSVKKKFVFSCLFTPDNDVFAFRRKCPAKSLGSFASVSLLLRWKGRHGLFNHGHLLCLRLFYKFHLSKIVIFKMILPCRMSLIVENGVYILGLSCSTNFLVFEKLVRIKKLLQKKTNVLYNKTNINKNKRG